MGNLETSGDHWLSEPLREQWEWAEHFARQLEVEDTDGSADLEGTLVFVLRQVDELFRQWPPPDDVGVYQQMAADATKYLRPVELYATLLAGPPRWRMGKVPADCKWDRLAKEMRPIVSKALGGEVYRVVRGWVDLDIRKLKERRIAAIEARKKAKTSDDGAVDAEGERVPYYKRFPPGERDAPVGQFKPPPRI